MKLFCMKLKKYVYVPIFLVLVFLLYLAGHNLFKNERGTLVNVSSYEVSQKLKRNFLSMNNTLADLIPKSTVELSCPKNLILAGSTAKCTYKLKNISVAVSKVEWGVSGIEGATINNGEISVKAKGKLVVTVAITLVNNDKISASTEVLVVEGISKNPSIPKEPGGSKVVNNNNITIFCPSIIHEKAKGYNCTYSVSPADSLEKITWRTIGIPDTIINSTTGEISAPTVGMLYVSAEGLFKDGSKSTSNTVEVQVIRNETIVLNPPNDEVKVVQPRVVINGEESIIEGKTTQLTYEIIYDKNDPTKLQPTEVKWTINDNKFATIDQNGMVKGIKKSGNSKIIITLSVSFGKNTASDTHNIKVLEDKTLKFEKVELVCENTCNNYTGFVGGTFDIDYVVTPAEALATESVTWYSNNPSIAKIDSSGVVEGISAGVTSIVFSAKDKVGNVKNITKVITIKNKEPNFQLIGPDKLIVGSSYTYEWQGDNIKTVVLSVPTSSKKILTVIGNTVKAVSEGVGEITAKVTTDIPGYQVKTYTKKVTVVSQSANFELFFDTADYQLLEGSTLQMGYKTNPSGVSLTDITWSSSNTKAATISNNGLVTALKAGESTTIKLKVNSGGIFKEITRKIFVIDNNDVYLELGKSIITKGEVTRVTLKTGNGITLTGNVTWKLSDQKNSGNVITYNPLVTNEGVINTLQIIGSAVGEAVISAEIPTNKGTLTRVVKVEVINKEFNYPTEIKILGVPNYIEAQDIFMASTDAYVPVSQDGELFPINMKWDITDQSTAKVLQIMGLDNTNAVRVNALKEGSARLNLKTTYFDSSMKPLTPLMASVPIVVHKKPNIKLVIDAVDREIPVGGRTTLSVLIYTDKINYASTPVWTADSGAVEVTNAGQVVTVYGKNVGYANVTVSVPTTDGIYSETVSLKVVASDMPGDWGNEEVDATSITSPMCSQVLKITKGKNININDLLVVSPSNAKYKITNLNLTVPEEDETEDSPGFALNRNINVIRGTRIGATGKIAFKAVSGTRSWSFACNLSVVKEVVNYSNVSVQLFNNYTGNIQSPVVGDSFDLSYQLTVNGTAKTKNSPEDTNTIWYSSNPEVAQIFQNGSVLIKTPGSATIYLRVVDKVSSRLLDSEAIEMNVPDVIGGLYFSQNSYEIQKGGDYLYLTPTLKMSNSNIDSSAIVYEWSSEDSTIASVTGTKENSITGVIKGLKFGTTYIKVNAKYLKKVIATKTIAVKVVNDGIDLQAVSIVPQSISLAIGEGKQLEINSVPSAVKFDAQWKSSNAKVVKVNQTGYVEAISSGTAIITLTATKDDVELTAQATVTVVKDKPIEIINISIKPSDPKINVGEVVNLEVSIYPMNSTISSILWSSNDVNVATIDKDSGQLTGISHGSAKITATITDSRGQIYTKETFVTVTDNILPTITKVTVEVVNNERYVTIFANDNEGISSYCLSLSGRKTALSDADFKSTNRNKASLIAVYYAYAKDKNGNISDPYRIDTFSVGIPKTPGEGNKKTQSFNNTSSNILKLAEPSEEEEEYTLFSESYEMLTLSSDYKFDPSVGEYEITTSSPTFELKTTLSSGESYVKNYESRIVSLNYGLNEHQVRIKSSVGTKVYSYIINRKEDRSYDNLLKELKISSGTLYPEFNPYVTDYKLIVDEDLKEVTFNGVLNSIKAKYSIGFEPTKVVLDKNDSKTVYIKTTSEIGTERTYTIEIMPEVLYNSKIVLAKEDNLKLKSVELQGLNFEFFSDIYNYNIFVPYEISKLSIGAQPKVSSSSVYITGGENLEVGPNQVTIKVVDKDNNNKIYTINVIRKELGLEVSSDSKLKSLNIAGAKINFNSSTLYYNLRIRWFKRFKVEATPNDAHSELSMLGMNLNKSDYITLRVVAEDGSTSMYQLNILSKKDYTLALIAGISAVSALLIIIVRMVAIRRKIKF